MSKVSRRKFLIWGGLGTVGTLAIGTYLARNPIRRAILETVSSTVPPYDGEGTEAALWFELTPENKVIFHSPKVEMGQGIFTGFAQIIAEEMDLTLDQVVVKGAATDTGVIDGMSTGGSLSIAGLWQPLRELAAMMREMLKIQAAQKLNEAVETLSTREGIIKGAKTQMTYVEAASGVNEWTMPAEDPKPKATGYKFIGKPVPRVDLEDKVYGAPIYGLDAELPGMLHAAIIRSGTVGAKFKSADTSKAASMPGVVKVVQKEDWVGVVAESYAEALAAKQQITVEWDIPEIWTEEKLRDTLKVGQGDKMITQKYGGSLDDDAGEVQTMEFSSPIGAHAQLEPNGAIADFKDDKVTVILSTQVIRVTRSQVAEALGLEVANVNVIPTQLGGGFGRRLNTYHAIQAAQLSKAVGKPVKYIFTRKEEFQNDQFRPPTHHVMKGRLDADGYLESLEHHYASGDVAINSVILPPMINTIIGTDLGAARGADIMYGGIANRRAVQWHTTLPFATSWWRSLGLLANTFAIESFIDEMALQSGKHPVDFRLRKMGSDTTQQRIRKVIEVAAEKAGYRDDVIDGRAMGLAASIDANSPAAQVVEVSIDNGKIKVHKVTCAFDCGLAVNPDQVKAQCEGSIIMGMSAGLFEKMTLRNGELWPTIYGPYEMALMRHAPREIDVHLIQGADVPLPVGEPPLGPVAAAIGNAVRRLTGIRLTDIPMQEAYEKAMQQKAGV